MTDSPLFINSIEKGLLVLGAFRRSESLNLQEIARHCGFSTGSAQRAAFTLEQLGYLKKEPGTKRYRLTVKAMELGYAYLVNEPLFQSAHATMHQLNQECGESVNLSVPDDEDMVFVMRVHTFKHVPVYMPIGTRIPRLSSASGRAVLSCLPEAEVEQRFESSEVKKHTARTTTDIPTLREIVQLARSEGYAWAEEEFFPGDVNVAAAVLDHAGLPVAAVNISVPKPRWTLDRARHELSPLVMRAARAISKSRAAFQQPL